MEKLAFERPVIKKVNAGMPGKFGMKQGFEVIARHRRNTRERDSFNLMGRPSIFCLKKPSEIPIGSALNAFTKRYPKIQFSWSYKTNYLDAVCRVFHQEGSWAEVVSGFEYDKAIKNNVRGDQIIFNGPDKSDEDLNKAIQNNSMIHIDHFDEMYALIDIAEKAGKKARVAIRVNMDTGIYPMWDRFGFNYENGDAWDALNRIMMNEHLDLTDCTPISELICCQRVHIKLPHPNWPTWQRTFTTSTITPSPISTWVEVLPQKTPLKEPISPDMIQYLNLTIMPMPSPPGSCLRQLKKKTCHSLSLKQAGPLSMMPVILPVPYWPINALPTEGGPPLSMWALTCCSLRSGISTNFILPSPFLLIVKRPPYTARYA